MYFLFSNFTSASYEDGAVDEAEFVHAFSIKYKEDEAITRPFFNSMDFTGDKKLNEIDFIIYIQFLDPDRK